MPLDPITGAEQVVDDIVNQVGSNVNSGVTAKAQALSLAAAQDQEQAEVTKKEAESESFWKAGARPMLLWVGVISLTWFYFIHPILTYLVAIIDPLIVLPPSNEPKDMEHMVDALLGVSAMRSYEKYNPWK